ncbi:MAG: beta-ketoacyl-[acyl-carrier-protein] synthase family protein [Deltaproteobacteria bacterium]|jgi:3-oxoacyl-[acyl-carrier-protein] synthase II|nr:beta-ketoacyl-[acyl-carrier-protein] synthase family protein [Deltaproteobacteria bacterium]
MASVVWITDVNTVTALGRNLEDLWQRLLSGHSAIIPVDRFSLTGYKSSYAATIKDLNCTGALSAFHDLLTRLFHDMETVPADARLYTATAKAGIDNLERIRRSEAADASDVLINAVADQVTRQLGLTGTGINISAACASSAIAVAKGAALIAAGRAECVLVCCIDLVTEFVFSGFSALGALSATPCMPFDRNRSGLTLGEGAAALLLMKAERAKKEGRPHLATVLGWGVASDGFHVTAPDPDGRGLLTAVKEAMKRAGLAPETISAVCAHGTGTVYNDSMELTAFDQLFKDRKLPVYSIKGAVGHTLGAAGGIEVAVALKSLSEGIVPPTVGFGKGDERAVGRVSFEPAVLPGNHILSTNSGFGGINAALILAKGRGA